MIRPIGGAHQITLGENTFVNTGVRIAGKVSIGRNVLVGSNVSFETAAHRVVPQPDTGRGLRREPIQVEDGVWIGSGATILSGVTVGRGAVVAAGAVVTADVPAFTVVGGVPARVLRKIDESAED